MTTATETQLSTLTLSRSALAYNLQAVQNTLPPNTQIMAMVKGNGYGTCAITLAKTLSELGVGHFGVATVEEGCALRRAGVAQDILVCYFAPHEANLIAQYDLQPAVWSQEALESLPTHRKTPVHLHINTGMNRFGCRPAKALELAEMIKRTPHLRLQGLMTHLASADAPLRDFETRKQLADFKTLLQTLDAPYKHALNSAGLLRFRLPETNLVRVGLALFGLYASSATKERLSLQCALSLTSRLVHIQECQAGERVSYGGHYVVDRKSRIGVVPLGYFDGLPLSHAGSVLHICGKEAPIVGAICMDFLMCDLTFIPEASIGEEVVVFDAEHRPETFAASGKRTIYELITCLGPRIVRTLGS